MRVTSKSQRGRLALGLVIGLVLAVFLVAPRGAEALTLTINNTNTTTLCGNVTIYDTIVVNSGGKLAVCEYNGTSNTGYAWLQNIANFTVQSGGTVLGFQGGYRGVSNNKGEGIGGGLSGGSDGAGGAGHGGVGGAGDSGVGVGNGGDGGIAYGSSTLYSTVGNISNAGDMNLGSAGGGAIGTTGGDGGALFIVSGTATSTIDIHGTISMNATTIQGVTRGGGGAGGEVVLYGQTINISGGTIAAKGGNGGTFFSDCGGGGGGGRIKVIYRTLINTSTTMNVSHGLKGCSDGVDGSIGSIYYYKNSTFFNNPPAVLSSASNQTQIFTNIDIPFNLTASDADSGDTLTAYVQPYINGTKNGTEISKVVTNGTNTNIMTFGSGNFSKHDSVLFEYWVGDGIANSTKANTTAIVVSNSLSATPSGYTNLGNRLTDHTPATSWTNGADSDGDTITTYIYVGTTSTPTTQDTNTTNEFTDLGNMVTLSDATTYYYRLRAYDGEEFSASYTTADEFRMNGLPITSTPSILPNPAYSTTAELMCQNGTTTDSDNDTTTLHYNWYKGGVSLGYDLKNITNGNYSPNSVMICEIWVADPYETNTTKLNSSSVTITPIAPVINANSTYITNGSVDMTPSYGETIKLNANVTDADNDISGVWFTLLSPNGTYIYQSINGTRYNTDFWNSSSNFTLDSYGSWMANITVNDTTGLSASQQWNFTVSLGTLSISPTSATYSQKAGFSKQFNITLSHTGNSNNTINITSYDFLTDVTFFTAAYTNALTGATISNLTLQEGASYIVTTNITSNSSLASAQYKSNITFGRTNDNSFSNFTVTTVISALTGVIAITPTSWSVSQDSSSTAAQTFSIQNTGDYALSDCNVTIAAGLTSDTTFNDTDFTVIVGATKQFIATISTVSAGNYSDTMTVICTATANNGIDSQTTAITATITQYVAPVMSMVTTVGGGAYIQPSVLKDVFDIDNIDQYVERYTGTITNIYRDEFRVVNKNGYDLNVTLGFDCLGTKQDFCDYTYFELRDGRRVKQVVAQVKQKAGVNPGYTYLTVAHNATSNMKIGNYTYFITAQSDDGVKLPPVAMVVSVTDIAPSWVYVMADLLNNRIFISLFMILIVVLILFAFIGKLRRERTKRQKKADEDEGRLIIADTPQG